MGEKPNYNAVVNFDFASMYPTTMKVFDIDIIKMEQRRLKLEKIRNNILQ